MFCIQTLYKNELFKYVLISFLCLLLACFSNDYDYDLFARLIVGEHFFSNGWITYQDFLSYTPTHLWYDHEWGASVIFYFFYKLFGAFGLILIQAILMFFTIFFIIKTQRLQKHAFPTSLFLIAIFALFYNHLNPSIVRCHLFSFMFFSVFLYILEKNRKTSSNVVWLIPILIVIWNNIHGGVVSGLGMIFLYIVSAILTKSPIKKLLSILCISTILLCINPYGIDYLNFLFSANTMNRKYITEWWSVFSTRHIMYYFSSFCIGTFTIGLALRKKTDITKLLLILTTTILGFLHVKLLSLTIITAFALYSNEMLILLNKSILKVLNKLSYIIIPITILLIPLTFPNIPRVDITKFPVLETEFIKLNNIKGNIVTSFGLGSYVAYKLYPKNLIYMDGRYEEVYYNKEFETLLDYEIANPNWEDIWIKYPTDILMPVKTTPAYNRILQHPDWKLVYEGEVCGVFLKRNQIKNKFKKPPTDIKYYQKTAFDNFGKFGEAN